MLFKAIVDEQSLLVFEDEGYSGRGSKTTKTGF